MSTHFPREQESYELLDSGEGMKLERFGAIVLSRPDPEALWPKKLASAEWQKADGIYERKGKTGAWKKSQSLPKAWTLSYGRLIFELRPTSFKHVGLFPEQESHWSWLSEHIASSEQPISVLNLFAYTGGASLSAAKAGASVTHVDASKVAIDWARKNAELSGLAEAPIRWIEDDVLKFLRREVKRGNSYDVIIMDPPAFGHGSGTSIWKIERDFYELFALVQKVLSADPLAVIVNGYTAGYSPLAFENNLLDIQERFGGTIETGELALKETAASRKLPAGVFSRWSKY